jgi:hypothetical protein
LLNDTERPLLLIFLKFGFIHLASNETVSVEDSVGWVGVECVLGGIINQSFVSE